MEAVCLVVASPPVFDGLVFLRWTEGKTEEEVARERIEMLRSGKLPIPFTNARDRHLVDSVAYREFALNLQSEWASLVRHEIYDHFRHYQLLEHFLYQPHLLHGGQQLLQIPEDVQSFVVDKYWALDDIVVREVIVKRLTKSRKDLDDVSESTGLNLRRVTRQFENIRRIYMGIEEDQKFECNLVEYCHSFGLSGLQARKYACVVFLLVSKFNLLNNRRIQRTSSEGLLLCAALILGCLAPNTDFFYQACKAVASAVVSQRTLDHQHQQISTVSSSPPSSLPVAPMSSASTACIAPQSVPTLSSHHPSSLAQATLPSSSSASALLVDPPSAKGVVLPSEKALPIVPPPPPILTSSASISAMSMDDETCESLLLRDDDLCWHVVWNVFERVDSMELDKGLLSNLRDVRNVITGEALDSGCFFVKKALEERGHTNALKKLAGDIARIRSVLKALMQIGANLSQTREYRDIFEDLINKVLEPLEDLGLSSQDIQIFLVCCSFVVKPLPGVNLSSNISSAASTPRDPRDRGASIDSISGSMRKVTTDKGRRLGKDWFRFVLCSRFLLTQLVRE